MLIKFMIYNYSINELNNYLIENRVTFYLSDPKVF